MFAKISCFISTWFFFLVLCLSIVMGLGLTLTLVGREEKSRVKGLVRLENVLRTLDYGLHCMP